MFSDLVKALVDIKVIWLEHLKEIQDNNSSEEQKLSGEVEEFTVDLGEISNPFF